MFYCQKKIKLSSQEIIKSKEFLPAFINKNNTLNKHFNSLVFEKKNLNPIDEENVKVVQISDETKLFNLTELNSLRM